MEERKHRRLDADAIMKELKKMIDIIDSAMTSRLLSYEGKYRMAIQRNTLLKVRAMCMSPEFMEKEEPAEAFALKKGNWYICTNDVLMNGEPDQVANTKGGIYQCLADDTLPDDFGNDYHRWGEDSRQEEHFRPWTIEDAKDGDVLATKGGGLIVRFKRISDSKCFVVSHYHHTNINIPELRFVAEEKRWPKDLLYPATEEQCELLDRNMRKAGYEWDYEKNELKSLSDADGIPADEHEKSLYEYTGVRKAVFDLILNIDRDQDILMDENAYMSYIRKHAPVILDAARKQLRPEIDAEIEKAYRTADEMQFKKGYDKAVEETKEALLSEVLPCFMYGWKAGKVVAKLSEVLENKKEE